MDAQSMDLVRATSNAVWRSTLGTWAHWSKIVFVHQSQSQSQEKKPERPEKPLAGLQHWRAQDVESRASILWARRMSASSSKRTTVREEEQQPQTSCQTEALHVIWRLMLALEGSPSLFSALHS